MTPDAIIVFPGGVIQRPDGSLRSTTYEEGDAFGILGGRDRVEAAAILAKKYPAAYVVTSSPVYAAELVALGIEERKVLNGKDSSNTQSAVSAAVNLGREKGWKHIVLLSSGYHLPRIRALYGKPETGIAAELVSSESVLIPVDPVFATEFAAVQKTPAYQRRLSAEARGLVALKEGTYRSASAEDKRER